MPYESDLMPCWPLVAKSKKLSTKLFGLYNDESMISHRMIKKGTHYFVCVYIICVCFFFIFIWKIVIYYKKEK